MRIVLANSKTIGFDQLVTAILRTDCTPVPITLEFQVRMDDELLEQLKEKSIIHVTNDDIPLKIIYAIVDDTAIIKDDKQVKVGSFIAILDGCENIIKPSSKAIYLQNTSIGAVLKACGVRTPISEDVPLLKFFVPLGETPTFMIARALIEEAAVMFIDENGKIAIRRLSSIMQGNPKLKINASSIKWISSEARVRAEVPTYLTVNKDGSTVEGEIKPGTTAKYIPLLDQRRLKNISTALVTKGITQRAFSPDIASGDIFEADGSNYVVLTGAHRFDTGGTGKQSASASKFWLAQVESI